MVRIPFRKNLFALALVVGGVFPTEGVASMSAAEGNAGALPFETIPALPADGAASWNGVDYRRFDGNDGRTAVAAARGVATGELTAHRLSFAYATEGAVNRFPGRAPLRLRVVFHGNEKAMKADGFEAVREFPFAPSADEARVTVDALDLLAPVTATSCTLEVFFEGSGSLRLGGIAWTEIPLPEGVLRVGKKIWIRTGIVEEAAVACTPEEKAQGRLVYQREPSRILPESRPAREEIRATLRKFAAPGEYCNLPFALFATEAGRVESFVVSDLLRDDGAATIPAARWQRFRVPFRNKPVHGRRDEFVSLPEVLYPFEPFDLAAEGNALLWLQAELPADTAPGFYSGTVRLDGDGRALSLPLVLRVLPFTLARPPVDWVMYGGRFRGGAPADVNRRDVQERHFAEIAAYGQTGMIVHGGLLSEALVREFAGLLDGAGMRGPLVLDFGWQLEAAVFRDLRGRNISDHRRFPFPENQDPEVAEGFVRYLRNVDGWMRDHFRGSAWYYQGIDEPHIYGGLSQAAWEYPLAKKAGVKTSSTVYPLREFTQFGKWGLDVAINSTAKFSERGAAELATAAARQGTTLWMLGPGSYHPGTGIVNRYQGGFLFHRTRLPVCVSWTYGGGPDRDELAFGGANFYMVYARREFAVPGAVENPARRVCNTTLPGEGLREGVQDYRYVHTLKVWTEKARAAGLDTARADALLRRLDGELIPYWEDVGQNGVMDEPAMERLRWSVAEEILRLREALP